MISRNVKKKIIFFNILNSFNNVNKNLNDEHKNIHIMKRQIISGNRVLSNIRTINKNNNNNNFHSFKNINENNKNNLFKNIDTEIKPINRLNIYNYLEIYNTEEKYNLKNNILDDKNKASKIIKSLLGQLSIENKNKIIQNKLKLKDQHDCNKRKKLKLKPINMKFPILGNSASKSNKSIFASKIIYYNKDNKFKDKKINLKKIKNYLDNQNTSYYSTLFKNTSVNIIKKKNGESEFQNPYYSPSLRRNLWEDFHIIDNEENETYEKSIMIKEGINDINNNKYKKPLYLSVNKRDKYLEKKNNDYENYDITKIKSIKEIENILFKKKSSSLYKNINLKKKNLNPIIKKKINNINI